jgi:hemerythrin superfamily protein
MNFNNPMVVGAAAAAAGVVAGLAATVGRKAAVQAVSALSGDWLEALKAEHRYALGIFDKIEATTDDQTAKRMTLLTQLKHALGKHAFEEENVVYPALRDLGDKEAADKLNHEHGYVKQYLYDLENMPRDDVRWMAKLGDFRRDLQRHIREEEDRILPGMRSRLTAEQNAKLSAVVNKEGFKLA